MKKVILLLLSLFVISFELYAQDFTLNGKPYYVKGLRVFDESSHRLSNNELKTLSEYGFDYEAWQKLKVYRNLGVASITIGVSLILFTKPYDCYDVTKRFAIGFALLGSIAIEWAYLESDHLLYILNDRTRIGLTPHGLGLTINFQSKCLTTARDLYITMGHELVHLSHYYIASQLGYAEIDINSRGYNAMTEYWAYSFEYEYTHSPQLCDRELAFRAYPQETMIKFFYKTMLWYKNRKY